MIPRTLASRLACFALLSVAPAAAQTGLEVRGVPAVNFDADEGFGYGVVAALYQYGEGTAQPYVWSLQPTVFLTTGGRRDFTLFFDAPDLIGRWRLDAFAGSQEQIATPWYGVGNAAVRDPSRITDDDPRFYRFGRTLRSVAVNVQRPVSDTPLRVLLGLGATHGSIVAVPEGEGTTLLAGELEAGTTAGIEGWANHLRVGLVWDTRDRETAPGRGSWSDVLVQRVDEALGSEVSYTRWTVTDRRYLPVGRLVFAHRVLLQGVSGEAPLFDLHRVQTSFRDQDGLGGAKSVRGLLRNRYAGRGLFIWNAELRWRALDFHTLNRPFHLVVSAFADAGRVWEGQPRLGELVSDLHRGWGGGLRLGMGADFVVATDVGTGEETGLQLYIGLGYLF